eukprot:scaffold78194_cov69-Phaeocystis_antarctica.AAC.2
MKGYTASGTSSRPKGLAQVAAATARRFRIEALAQARRTATSELRQSFVRISSSAQLFPTRPQKRVTVHELRSEIPVRLLRTSHRAALQVVVVARPVKRVDLACVSHDNTRRCVKAMQPCISPLPSPEH